MTVPEGVPTISITTPDLESKDLVLSSPLSAAPPSPTLFEVVNNIDVVPDVDLDQGPLPAAALDEGSEDQRAPIEARGIRTFYQDKGILITGATGFLGKALLWKLLSSLHQHFDKIYLLLRISSSQRRFSNPNIRLQDDILSDKAFIDLRRTLGADRFDSLVQDKLVPLTGDLQEPSLGLSEDNHAMLIKHVNVIFHCGANTDSFDLDIAVKTNALGTANVLQLANECGSLASFIHLSPLQTYGATSVPPTKLGALPLDTTPEDLLHAILTASSDDLPALTSEIQTLYTNAITFSKALAEHLLTSDVGKKQQSGFQQFPISILRLAPLGPSISEPLQAWADDVNGINGVLLLTGKGSRVIDTGHGEIPADVLPVDVAVRAMLTTAATIQSPSLTSFKLPETDKPNALDDQSEDQQDKNQQQPQPDLAQRQSIIGSRFPVILPVSTLDCGAITWRQAYEGIRWYWNRTSSSTQLAPASSYFTASAQGLSRARTMMNSIRSAASGYMGSNVITRTSLGNAASTSAPSNGSGDGRRSPRPTSSPRHSHRASRYVDKAARLAPGVMRSFHPQLKLALGQDQPTSPMVHLRSLYLSPPTPHGTDQQDQEDDFDNMVRDFDPLTLLESGEAGAWFWTQYFINASYGVDYYVAATPHVRLPLPGPAWSCALLFNIESSDSDILNVMDRQVRSEMYSPDQVSKRTTRMVEHLKQLLVQDDHSATASDHPIWLRDMDDCLEDWSQDTSIVQSIDHDRRLILGKWKKKVGNNDDAVKVVVLNDKRVNQAILQITQKAGVPRQTAVNEALRILMRMSERTQLGFVWFVGSFLKSFFDSMFDSIRVNEDQLRNLRHAILGKRVVYVPIAKSVLDPLLVWFFAIRYHLPVPALVCDEAMAQLGPISDIYRLAGAYYLKREKNKRSPLNSAVTAAYTQVLLREHGALSVCFERTRSRTGKLQDAFDDGLIEMIMESTLQSNQSRSSAVQQQQQQQQQQHASSSPPESPVSPATPASATMSMDSSTGVPRKAHRDIVLVPVNVTYENVPELPFLIDQVLDQQQSPRPGPSASHSLPPQHMGPPSTLPRSATMTSSHSSAPSYYNGQTSPSGAPLPSNVLRPSQSMDRRNGVAEAPKKYGRVHLGLGDVVSVQDVAHSHTGLDDPSLAKVVTHRVQQAQRRALIVTPVSLVCAIVLYGRAVGGVCLGKIKEFLAWLHTETIQRNYASDWQDGEDLDAIVMNAFRLINDTKNLIIEGKTMTDDTNIRVNDHADNIMALSYYANQMVEPFLLDAFFAVVYLSFTEDQADGDEFVDRLRFLMQLLEKEFVMLSDMDTILPEVMKKYEAQQVLRKTEDGQNYQFLVTMEKSPVQYERLMLLASLIYPTIDNYWITSCSLSALERVPTLPRSIVPLLSQWIATHLITGRRTIYREVLSTESSRTAIDVFMAMGFLSEFPAKQKLTPDAQILLHELKIPTSETLIELTGQNSDGGNTPVSAGDPQGMMKALLAQIEMNRANSNMADLCQQIDSYRLGAASQRESFQNAQVFQKCLKQIKGIIQVDTTFAQKRNVQLSDLEDSVVQLVYALRVNNSGSYDKQSRALRRISEAYNLK
ncbi:hypothetical protein DM01DRAFT_1306806 [Hesseltinella vesiculosa]|uniref:Fatty acyl-CoA reductase n=1 Tax=Hesseltinella vesiculosa TaxID=101127 RepID=A0A1X2GF57_9FUNG|nr:hypothetical protein DM01DRAFT_1306806 [Hesseltinella vesiculosa]